MSITSRENKKLSFAEMTSGVDTAKHNSDLENLAHALKYAKAGIREEIKRHKKAIADMEELIEKIHDAAAKVEAGEEELEVGEVRKIYDMSRKAGPDL